MQTLYSGWPNEPESSVEYFAYLETRSRLPSDRALWDDGRKIVPVGWSEGEVAHLGFSSVDRRQFLDQSRIIIGSGAPRRGDAEWRADRAERLRRLFAIMPTRRIDLYASSPAVGAEALHRALQLGGWFRVQLTEVKAIAPAAQVFAVLSERDSAGRLAHVSRVVRVDRTEKRRLRHVFSLDHVGDLGGEEPGPEPEPDTPLRPGRALAVLEDWKPDDVVVVFGHAQRDGSELAVEIAETAEIGDGDETARIVDWEDLIERGLQTTRSELTPLRDET